MDTGNWVAVYTSIFTTMIIFIAASQSIQRAVKRMKRKRGIAMTNEILKEYIGKLCYITTSNYGYGSYTKVLITDVVDNWIKIDKNGAISLINADYVQSIKILENR